VQKAGEDGQRGLDEQAVEKGQRSDPQGEADIGPEAGAACQDEPVHTARLIEDDAQRHAAAEGMADERRPPDAQGRHEIPDETGIGRGAEAHPRGHRRPAEPGEVGDEDPVSCGQGADVGRPDLRRGAQAVDEHDRRSVFAGTQKACA